MKNNEQFNLQFALILRTELSTENQLKGKVTLQNNIE